MTIFDLIGAYKINGHNQDATGSSYQGELELSLDIHQRVLAKWNIGHGQMQEGTGFFKDNILVINFRYKNDQNQNFKGVVVYKCLSKNVLDGFWSEKYGDPNFLGTEQAFKIEGKTDLLN